MKLVGLVLVVILDFIVTCKGKQAQLTHFCSYPPCCGTTSYTAAEKKWCKGNSECTDYNGCKWEGQFAYSGKKSHNFVTKNYIFAFYSTHGDNHKYKNKRIRVTQGSHSITGIGLDTCSDSDCGGCCTRNASPSGYLIDMEANTFQAFGGRDGKVSWTCLDC